MYSAASLSLRLHWPRIHEDDPADGARPARENRKDACRSDPADSRKGGNTTPSIWMG